MPAPSSLSNHREMGTNVQTYRVRSLRKIIPQPSAPVTLFLTLERKPVPFLLPTKANSCLQFHTISSHTTFSEYLQVDLIRQDFRDNLKIDNPGFWSAQQLHHLQHGRHWVAELSWTYCHQQQPHPSLPCCRETDANAGGNHSRLPPSSLVSLVSPWVDSDQDA